LNRIGSFPPSGYATLPGSNSVLSKLVVMQ